MRRQTVSAMAAGMPIPAKPAPASAQEPGAGVAAANSDRLTSGERRDCATSRQPPTRRVALAIAAAATVLFGWLSQSNAKVITYSIGDDQLGAGGAFKQLPGGPLTPPAIVRIKGSFDYDAETHIQTNVRLQATGRLGAGDYAAVFPRETFKQSACSDCVIFTGRPAETGGVVQRFTETITIHFSFPLDGKVSNNPITKIIIDGGSACSGFPGCQTTDTFGVASSAQGRELPPALEFQMVRSAAAVAAGCLREAEARVTVTPLGPVEQMAIRAENLPPDTGFDLFVIQLPNPPFGLSWYQGDLESDAQGVAQGTFTGRFDSETFIVTPGVGQAPSVHRRRGFPDASSNPATAPVHTFHLGLWFDDPGDAAKAGCRSSVTPFSGDHSAGVQALSTRNFAKLHGPLRQLNSTVLRAGR